LNRMVVGIRTIVGNIKNLITGRRIFLHHKRSFTTHSPLHFLSREGPSHFLLFFFVKQHLESAAILITMTISEAHHAAALNTIRNQNQITREAVGNLLICLLVIFATARAGNAASLPEELHGVEESMDSWRDHNKMNLAIGALDLVRIAPFLRNEKMLPHVNRLMETDAGKAELLREILSSLTGFGMVRDKSCDTFQYGNDDHVQRALYLNAIQNDGTIRLFHTDITAEHMDDPSLLTLSVEEGGAPVFNAVNNKKNQTYATTAQKPWFYVGNSKRKLSQNKAMQKLGINYNTAPCRKIIALRSRWNTLPQGSKVPVRDTINGRQVTYK